MESVFFFFFFFPAVLPEAKYELLQRAAASFMEQFTVVMSILALFKEPALLIDSLKRADSFGSQTALQMFWSLK